MGKNSNNKKYSTKPCCPYCGKELDFIMRNPLKSDRFNKTIKVLPLQVGGKKPVITNKKYKEKYY